MQRHEIETKNSVTALTIFCYSGAFLWIDLTD